MTTIRCGLGQAYSTLASALAALSTGDTLETFGPYSENNQSLSPGGTIKNITWRHYGDDYTFDGTGATAAFLTFGTGNTGWDIDLLDQNGSGGKIKITGYIGDPIVYLQCSSTDIDNLWLTGNGKAGSQVTHFQLGAAFDGGINDLLIENATDTTTANSRGIVVATGAVPTFQCCIIDGLIASGATKDVYGFYFQSTPYDTTLALDCQVRNCEAHDRAYSYFISANGNANIGVTFKRCRSYGNVAGNPWGFYAWNGAMCIESCLVKNETTGASTERGILIDGSGTAISTSYYYNNTIIETVDLYDGCNLGNTGASALVARNNVVYGATWGYLASGASYPITSSNNLEYGGSGFNSRWPKAASDITADPLFVDASSNYRLRTTDKGYAADSPCIKSGFWIATRTRDIDRHPMGRNTMDRGCYQHQYQNPRSTRFARAA